MVAATMTTALMPVEPPSRSQIACIVHPGRTRRRGGGEAFRRSVAAVAGGCAR
jgi:hypothetical protein